MKSLNYISKDDYFSVKLGSMLASYDRELLTLLYQPIIGYSALALYFTLWSEAKRCEFTSLSKHSILVNEMGMDISTLYEARCALEGIGLLRTYREKDDSSVKKYLYELYAPKNPQDFFDDVIFKGLLSKKIGSKEVKQLSLMLSSKELSSEGYEEITASYSDVYKLDENETLKVLNIKTSRGRKTVKIDSNFEIGEFFNELKLTSQISQEAFTSDDVEEIKRLATLFGLDVLSMVDIVNNVYDPNSSEHLDYAGLYKCCDKYKQGINITKTSDDYKEYDTNDAFGKKLNQMSTLAPFEYLKIKQGYTNPSPADVKIINNLSQNYSLTPGVINALVDYTLIQCNDVLSAAYIDKLAVTMVRKNITTALAACNALKGKRGAKKKVNTEKVEDNSSEKEEKIDIDSIVEDL